LLCNVLFFYVRRAAVEREKASAKIYKDTLRRVKTYASATDTTIVDLIERIVTPELDRLERERPARFSGIELPARGRRHT
jgi:hypothetical protein